MKNTFAFTILLISALFFAGCQPEKKEQNTKNDTDIFYLRLQGRAYLNEDKLKEAEEAFQGLLKMVPDDASANANLALIELKRNDYEKAGMYVTKALKDDPDDEEIRLISATYYQLTGQPQKAVGELERVVKKDPDDARALYNLASLYAQPGLADADAHREAYLMKTIEKAPANIVPRLDLITLLVHQGKYDEATQQLGELPKIFADFPKEASGFYDKTMQALHAADTSAAKTDVQMFDNFAKVSSQYQSDLRDMQGPEGNLVGLSEISLSDFMQTNVRPAGPIFDRIRFLDVTSNTGLDNAEAGGRIAVGDLDGDGFVDIYQCGSMKGNRLLKNSLGTMFKDVTAAAGIKPSTQEIGAVFGDYDNDGYPDLYVVRDDANLLYHNNMGAGLEEIAASAKVNDLQPGHTALFLDADHDGDLDLLITQPGANALYRNNGDGTFAEMAAAMGLALPGANCTDAAFADFDEDGDLDIVFASAETSNHLLSNARHGKFDDVTAASGLEGAPPAIAIASADYNNDGFSDLFFVSPIAGRSALYTNRGDGTFETTSAPWMKALDGKKLSDAVFCDFDNDGFRDLVLAANANQHGIILLRNNGDGSFEDVSRLLQTKMPAAQQVEAADIDNDGDLDIFLVDMKGGVHLLQNEGGNLNHYIDIKLVGLRNGNSKNNHFGIGAKVEIRAADLYQMQVVTAPAIHFGLGSHLKADVVRVTWTNGVAQDRFYPGTDQELLESQVLKGSCAFLYTWDGNQYTFSKDMMWRSALGMPLGIMGGNTAYAPADPSQEYLKIPGETMLPQDGKYRIQITEELWEAAYFDKLYLVALDHRGSDQVYVDERFTLPPYSEEYTLYSVPKKYAPVSAMDGMGTDVLSYILKKDDNYLSNFQVGTYQGITEMHDLILDPGTIQNASDLLLYLNGWIFPSDASINVALSQSDKLTVTPPELQVPDQNGNWITVIPNISFPMGKDKTMIVDLSGKFLSADHRVRIRTNMEIYWDQIFFAPKLVASQVTSTTLEPESADLHYRGFSRLFRKGGDHGPHWFDYSKVHTGQQWRDLLGNYTRYGDVTPLLYDADDKLVIMNSGDEMTVDFDATQLPVLPKGWKRDFLIYSEGWIKDGDFNTAHGKTVEPLPFHAMTRYPYGTDEAYPEDAAHQEYLRTYNTRQVTTQEFIRALSDAKGVERN